MKISTKGRYALRVMIELASSDSEKYISAKTISQHQNISEKYLEQIISSLNRAGIVKSTRGAMGGYKLVKSPVEYTVGMVLRSVEGSLAPVSCLEDEKNKCPRSNDCISLYVWEKIYEAVNDVVDTITIQDLLDHKNNTPDNNDNYVI
ncbi:MAG: Rrf2 family transcriptional regulator [Clostridia bacterium]|nr:Rrf2 family transcriptional regulator [Clostridia bacterium]